MTVQYDPGILQEIADNVNLVEYIGQDLELEKKGHDYFGHCPKHVDKTPSFSINPGKNLYYCFSCGRSGTIINYLMQYEGLKFDAAVHKAASIANVDLKHMCKSPTITINRQLKKKQHLLNPQEHKILDWNLYDKYIQTSIPEWEEEGIRKQELQTFQIRVDDINNRIVYPVFDMYGNFINVKGRTRFQHFKELKIPKYINYYPVGQMDYFQGFQQAEKWIIDSGEMKIFESIKSVMKMFGYDIKNVVSAEKHNLTIEQIKWIIKLRVRDVVLCWDSDISYQSKEILRDINILKRFVNVYIIQDPKQLLGGIDGKNSPIDRGFDIWEHLYKQKTKIV